MKPRPLLFWLISVLLLKWAQCISSTVRLSNIRLPPQKFYFHRFNSQSLDSLSQFSIPEVQSQLSAPVSSYKFDVFLLTDEDYNCYLFRIYYFKDWSAHCAFLDDPHKLQLNQAYFELDFSNYNGTMILLVDNTPFPPNGGIGEIQIDINHSIDYQISDSSSLYNTILALTIGGGILLVGLIILLVVVVRFGLQLRRINKSQQGFFGKQTQASTEIPVSSGRLWIKYTEPQLLEDDEDSRFEVKEVKKSWLLFKKPVINRSKFFLS